MEGAGGGGRELRLFTWVWELLGQAGDSLGPHQAPKQRCLPFGPLSTCLLSAFPADAQLSVLLPPLPTSPKEKTVRLVSACCTDFCRSRPDFWSVCQSACDLPLIAADSLAPRLPCMMPE